MAWTQEDIKDVMKKAVGTMIAAAVISLATEIYSTLSPLIFALIMLIAAAVIVIIIFLQPRSKSATPSPQQQASTPDHLPLATTVRETEEGSESVGQDAEVSERTSSVDLEAKRMEMEYKLRKKALKADKKARKKAEKENEN